MGQTITDHAAQHLRAALADVEAADEIGYLLTLAQQPHAQTASASNTTGFTATGSQVAGARENVINLTGTLGAGANMTLPTVANLVAAIPGARAGQSFKLRVINSSAGAFSWTVVTNTGWTLSGTMTIAQNTWREFVVTLTSLTTATLVSVGTGTTS